MTIERLKDYWNWIDTAQRTT